MLVFPTASEGERYAIAVIVAGMAGGAATVLAPLKWGGRFYLACLLMPASLMLLTGPSHSMVLGVLGLIYLTVIVNAHREAGHMLTDSFVRLEANRRLVAEAQYERLRAERLNLDLLMAQDRLSDQNSELEAIVAAERTEGMRLAKVAIENMAEGVIVMDGQGTILEVNPAFSRITGFTAAEVVGQNASRLRSERQDAGFYASMWTISAGMEAGPASYGPEDAMGAEFLNGAPSMPLPTRTESRPIMLPSSTTSRKPSASRSSLNRTATTSRSRSGPAHATWSRPSWSPRTPTPPRPAFSPT
ncbi:MAG: PAS domain-containing protein [Sulfuritalea sp.]|nr:PAS domain-containing protein [Sulfuritalea sp.]